MTNTLIKERPNELENGDITGYLHQRVFDDVIGSLRALVERKKAIADETRYSILYLLYETNVLGRKTLVKATGKDEEGLEHHLRKLLDANLIARVPTPDGLDGRRTYYRITALGSQEIESDLRNIHSQWIANHMRGSLQSLSEMDELADSVGSELEASSFTNPEQLDNMRHEIHKKRGKTPQITEEMANK